MYLKKNIRIKKFFFLLLLIQILIFIWFGKCFGSIFWERVKIDMALELYNGAVAFFVPQVVYGEETERQPICSDVIAAVLPSFSYHSQILRYESQTEEPTDFITLAAQENARMEALLEENEQAANHQGEQEGTETSEVQETLAKQDEADVQEENQNSTAKTMVKQTEINRKKLEDFDYLRQTFYQVDSTTTILKNQLNAADLLQKDMTLGKAEDGKPQILIYHTHSQEGYKDSVAGDSGTTVVGVGDYLTKLLTEQYGYQVLHHKGEYDVNDRDHAYTNAAPALEKLLEENPSIQVVIDLHRDGVAETTHLVTEVNGKQTAQIMFFNGLSRTTTIGDISWLPNPYIQDNLAFSFQLQLTAAEYYPGLTRRIYLKGYRYNMHYLPQSLLVEVGAQTNTVQEAMNAMEPLAAILDQVLSGKSRETE